MPAADPKMLLIGFPGVPGGVHCANNGLIVCYVWFNCVHWPSWRTANEKCVQTDWLHGCSRTAIKK